MSKEQDFHRLIEQQDTERKEELWKRIESQTEEVDDVSNSCNTLAKTRKNVINNKNLLIISSVFLLVAVLTLVTVILIPKNNEIDNLRYCKDGDYYIIKSDITLKQYANQNNLDILYFDWYDEIDYFEEQQFKLNDTDEVICLQEEIIDINGIYLLFYVTDDKTELDLLSIFSDLCIETTTIGATEVKRSINSRDSYAMFAYNGYRYYLKAEEVIEQDYVLSLVNDLLN